MSKRVLVTVAHPDDEVLWAGGYLANNPGTHVLCCCIPKKDPERCIHFFEACKLLGAEGYIAGRLAHNAKQDMYAAKLFASHYDEIITHNEIGEYGHNGHIMVHNAMKELAIPMRVFGYGLTDDGDPIDVDRKKEAISVYTSRPNVWRNQSANFDLSKETFL